MILAYRHQEIQRGWWLAIIGNALLILGFLLPEQAGTLILTDATAYLPDDVVINNPRVLPSGGMVLGLFGGYMVLFSGLQDLKRHDVHRLSRLFIGWGGVIAILLAFTSGSLDNYSFMVELRNNGERLQEVTIQHITFVSVSLLVGFVVGIGLGLWAARSKTVSPLILYAVGIIQTVPSLALFGLLLSPLAAFGNQLFTDIASVFLILTIITLAYGAFMVFMRAYLPQWTQSPLFLIGALVAAIPVALFTSVLVAFLYQVVIQRITNGRFADGNNIALALFAGSFIISAVHRFLPNDNQRERIVKFLTTGLIIVGLIFVVYLFLESAQIYINSQVNVSRLQQNNQSVFNVLTIGNLGISGIGVAPALIALTLYSLLPLVRNTYAGLNNVDPAIIDSGRGMGMTPSQIFFRIELPLAFPVIMAGVRNAGVALVGIGTIAQIIGGGGLGVFILRGINDTSIDLILLGLVPAVVLALVLDASLRLIETLFTSPGIRHVENT